MLIEIPYKNGDTVSLKLSSGEEIVARLVEENDTQFTLKKPMVLIMGADGLGLAPYMFSVNPDNKFVAGFIGSPSMNFLKGTVRGKNIIIPGLDNTAISTTIKLPKEGSSVLVGLRPQALTITKKKSSLKVHMRERLGGTTFDYLHTNTGERIIVETKSDDPIDQDTQIAISFNKADVLLFDAKTELRLR